MPEYATDARAPMRILDPANGLARGDRAGMASAIIGSVDHEPFRMIRGSDALRNILVVLQKQMAASTDFPPGQ
jgi:hypothetical protein